MPDLVLARQFGTTFLGQRESSGRLSKIGRSGAAQSNCTKFLFQLGKLVNWMPRDGTSWRADAAENFVRFDERRSSKT